MASSAMQQLVQALNGLDSNGRLDLVLRLYDEETPTNHAQFDESDEEEDGPPPYDTVIRDDAAPPYETIYDGAPMLKCRKCHGRFTSHGALAMTCPCHTGYLIGDGTYNNSGVRGSWSCCGRTGDSRGCEFRYHKLGSRWEAQKIRLNEQLGKISRLIMVR